MLDELSKEKPDLSYIRGMLEVLLDEPESIVVPNNTTVPQTMNSASTEYLIDNAKSDEEIVHEALKPGPLGKLT